MDGDRFGFEFVFLLGGAFRTVIDQLHADLARKGHPEARPIHGFALQAIGPDGVTTAGLGRRLGATKQAAGKTVKRLEELGYIRRSPDPADSRSTLLMRSELGEDLLARSADWFEECQRRWIGHLGGERYRQLFSDLEYIAGERKLGDLPGWLQERR